MANYEIVRASAPVERVTVHFTESQFKEILNSWRESYPNYYNSVIKGNYDGTKDDTMHLLVTVGRALAYIP